MGKVFDERAPVTASRLVGEDTCEVSLRSPRIARAARPGQFVDVLLPTPGFGYRVFESEEEWLAAPTRPRATLLRRPFSVYRAYASNGAGEPDTLDLLVKVVGEGTRQLAALEPGDEVGLLGPLGKSFALPPEGATAALVAGGCGWANLSLLARELRRRGHPTYAFIGARTVEGLPVETSQTTRPHSLLEDLPEACVTSGELEALGIVVGLAAEQGGRVYSGLVTDLLRKLLLRKPGGQVWVYACGPWAMLRVVADLARERAVPCQVALEERMGCGVGVCNSCVVEVILPDGAIGHKKLCTEGPVLDAAEVNWDQERG